MTRIIILLLFLLLTTAPGRSQTILIDPTGDGGFESGNTFLLNGWTLVNTPPVQNNQWYCGNGATGFTGSRCAHIGTSAANNNYNPNQNSVVHFYRDVVFPAAQPNVTLSFSWKGYGEYGYDYLQVSLLPVTTVITAGNYIWTGQIGAQYNQENTWQSEVIALPCSTAGTTQRLVFTWVNDAVFGTNPGAAIDNISLVANPTTLPCANLLGTGYTAIASLPYNSGAGTTCGQTDDLTPVNTTACGDPYYLSGEDRVWSFTPSTSGQVSISLTAPLAYSTSLMLYSGCPAGCNGSTSCIAYVQDYSGDKSFCVSVTAGTTYYLVLDSYYGCNPYDNLSVAAPVTTPPGTTCNNPYVITALPFSLTGETTVCYGNDYNNSTPGSCGTLYESGDDKVYRYVSTGTECLGISISNGSTSSIGYQVYQGCPGAGGVCISSKGGYNPLAGSVVLPAAGTYYIIVDSWAPPSGCNYDISITSFGSGPVNDLPCNATPLGLSVLLTGDNSCSSGSGEPASPACWYNGVMNTIWYSVICPPSGQLRVATQTGTLTDTQIGVYSGSCNALTLVPNGCNDNTISSCSGALFSEVILSGLTPGNTYYIRVDGNWDLIGTFSIMATDGSVALPATTQDCNGAIGVCQSIITQPQSYFGCGNNNEISPCPAVSNPCTNVNGTNQGCMLANPAELNAVWYLINITSNGSLRWTCTQGSSGFYDWSLYDITNNSCADIKNNLLPPVRCNWNSSSTSPTGMQSPVPGTADPGNFEQPLNVAAGEVYVLLLSNYSSTTGGYTMNFTNSTCMIGSPATVTWTGSSNTTWTVSNNWGSCAPPVCGINANISPASNQPVLTANETVKDLMIMPGASLTLNPGVTLTVCGNYSNYGTLNASPTSTILFNNGPVNQSINGSLTGTSQFGNLTVTKTGGSVMLNADIDITGNFTTSNNTSIFNTGGKVIRLAGNFANAGGGTTFTNCGTTGMLEFNGAAAQAYSAGGTLTLNHILMNHTGAGVSVSGYDMLSGPTGNVTLNSGRIITNGLELKVTNTAPGSVTTGNAASFVQGNLRRSISGSPGSYDFPVGHAVAGYQRANVTFTTATSIPQLLASFHTYTLLPSGPLSSECPSNDYSTLPVLDNGYWNISASANPTSGNYDMTLYNTGYTNGGTAFTVVKSAVSPPTSASWVLDGTCNLLSTISQTRRDGMNGFSAFGTGTASNPLPVELLHFDAVLNGDIVETSWSTASETNNLMFRVEKSPDTHNFELVGTVPGNGTTSLVSRYSLDDPQPWKGLSYYRLRQVDINGDSHLSKVVTVEYKINPSDIFVYPVPAGEVLYYRLNSPSSFRMKVQLADATGRIILTDEKEVTPGENTFSMNTAALAEGVYNLRISRDEGTWINARVIKNLQAH